jgi:hypothetical protein
MIFDAIVMVAVLIVFPFGIAHQLHLPKEEENMKNKSLRLPIIIISIGIIIAIAASLLLSMQKTPTITNRDFNFSITYKLDGETKTINGVYSSRFAGFGGNGIDPLCRYYDGTYKFEGEDDGDRCFTIAEKDGYELYIVALLNDYYLMGDKENESYDSYTEGPTLEAEDKDGNQYGETELPGIFNAEIVSFKYPEPIENTFYFTGFAGLYVISTGAMTLIGILTLILCMIFVRKGDGVEYRALDKINIALNFVAMLFVLPIIYIASVFVQAYKVGPDWLYQAYLCIPQIIPFSIAASLSLRRKGFRKSGFFIQFLAPAIEVIFTILEYIL